MKKNFLIILLTFFFSFINAQNLVNNPGFEVDTACPTAISQIANSLGWNSFRVTPDYYNSCSNQQECSVPSNYFGYQFPHTGNAYAGVFAGGANYREIIATQLSYALIVGQKYYISFYCSLAIHITTNNTLASNNMGAFFLNHTYHSYSPDQIPINNIAHIHCNNIITDTANWTQIIGSFVADSAYQYIAIGNFFDDAHTDTLRILGNGGSPQAYYYIDDVCVSTDSVYASTWATTGIKSNIVENKLNIYPNPANTYINCKLQTANCKLQLTDVLGNTIKEQVIKNEQEIIDVSSLPNGIYFLNSITSEGVLSKKIVVQH